MNEKFLALDIGDKKVGLAVSSGGLIARPIPTIRYQTPAELISQLKEICRREKISRLIIGLPLKSDLATEQTKKTERLGRELAKKLALPCQFVDESYTTISDNDSDSAVLILEQHLSQLKT
ncbi:MAG: putative holliday junction resolvase [Candidatus Berkelbacteria bacterium Licking1014_2]|uniref:Putative pre-16S rRNA nuclease n=1 Tax=Candidatus Berkelbacteria bacterium Licking1014_2 TaxID=2017146 RepID=A0A554LUD1_9BACT|nr:MAG: putative holliday junction resolvase [Candidatus Berkelbacteria bacterium Licking1014_2]